MDDGYGSRRGEDVTRFQFVMMLQLMIDTTMAKVRRRKTRHVGGGMIYRRCLGSRISRGF